jgi:hypothetical protein
MNTEQFPTQYSPEEGAEAEMDTIELSRDGGVHRDAEEIARLLAGHPDHEHARRVQEFLNNEDR